MARRAAFTEADVRAAAGGRSFERGLEYLEEVEELDLGETAITATVYGGDVYEVVLSIADHGLDGKCSCPYGQEGHFCKHCVAVALVAIRASDARPTPIGRRAKRHGWIRWNWPTGCSSSS